MAEQRNSWPESHSGSPIVPPKGTGDKQIRIALLWHSLSSGNLGIGALTLSNAAIVSEVVRELGFEPQFVVLGMEDGEAAITVEGVVESHSVTLRSLVSPKGVWAHLGRVACVIDISAGDSFTDAYGYKRFWILMTTKILAMLRRKPLLLAPQTIGPFRSISARIAAGFAMRRAVAIVTRDAPSLDLARELAPRVLSAQSIDVTFGMPFDDRSAERDGERLRLGVNVSGLLFSQAESGTNRFGLSYDYAVFSRHLLARLTGLDGVEVHLLTHTTSRRQSADDDGRAADQLCAEFPTLIRVPDFAGPAEAKSYISSLDFLVSARMHACIAAFSAGTPVLPVAYSRKFSGLFSAIGYETILPMSGCNEQEAVEMVLTALHNRRELGVHAGASIARTEALLDRYRAVLRHVIGIIEATASPDQGGKGHAVGEPPVNRIREIAC